MLEAELQLEKLYNEQELQKREKEITEHKKELESVRKELEIEKQKSPTLRQVALYANTHSKCMAVCIN